MIKLFGRMIPAAARGLCQPRLPVSDTVHSRFRVLPHDIDLNLHLNNGRYMQIIDVNRMEYLLRTGVAAVILAQGWKAVLGGTTIQFRRELRLWEQAVTSTRLLGWDDRWCYLEHRVETRSGRVCAIALAKAGFRRAGAWVPIDELVAALPHAVEPMALPAHVLAWQGLDKKLTGEMSKTMRINTATHQGPRMSAAAQAPAIRLDPAAGQERLKHRAIALKNERGTKTTIH